MYKRYLFTALKPNLFTDNPHMQAPIMADLYYNLFTNMLITLLVTRCGPPVL